MVATCLFGLEKLLGEEIDALGMKRTETIDGRVTFEGTPYDVARANINLRCAERVFIKLGSFGAQTFDELFEGTKSLPWESFIGKNDIFPVKGHSIKSKLFSLPDCQKIVKKAIVDRLASVYGITRFAETDIKYQVEFFIFKDTATLMIDTTGMPLHKRGYRPAAGAAPLRETLAAAMALISRPRPDVLFWDPLCGSGTIAIEAAMILGKIAPGTGRGFAAEGFPQFEQSLWRRAREEALGASDGKCDFEVYASDIDTQVLEYAKENARRAGVEKNIKIFRADARKIEKPDRKGTIVCNPPYGERMMEREQAEQLYRELGANFSKFVPWQIYIITSCEYFEKLYGRRADKIRKLYNGMIPCSFYQYFKPQTPKR